MLKSSDQWKDLKGIWYSHSKFPVHLCIKLFPNPIIVSSPREANIFAKQTHTTKSWYAKDVWWPNPSRSARLLLLHLRCYHTQVSVRKTYMMEQVWQQEPLVILFVSTHTTAKGSMGGTVKREVGPLFASSCTNMKQNLDLDCNCLSLQAVRYTSTSSWN